MVGRGQEWTQASQEDHLPEALRTKVATLSPSTYNHAPHAQTHTQEQALQAQEASAIGKVLFFPRFVKLMSNRDLQVLPGFVLAAAMRCAAGIVAGCRARGRQDPGPDAGEEDRL